MVTYTLVRKPNKPRNKEKKTINYQNGALEKLLPFLISTGIIVLMPICIFTDISGFTNYQLPILHITGVALITVSGWLFHLFHRSLDQNRWVSLKIMDEHVRLTVDIKKGIRSSLLAALHLPVLSVAPLLNNRIASLSGIIFFEPLFFHMSRSRGESDDENIWSAISGLQTKN